MADDNPESDPLKHAQQTAANFGGDWQLDDIPELFPEPEPVESVEASESIEPPSTPPTPPTPTLPPPVSRLRFGQLPPESDQPPPSPDAIVEAMLFIGGAPLTAEKACSAIRGLTGESFLEIVSGLIRKYRRQLRPYTIRQQGEGYLLGIRSEYRYLKERLQTGPREARLTQPALDVLSLVAYRQPIAKPDLDALRGADSTTLLRLLVRLGLIASSRQTLPEGEGKATVVYNTTSRFLELFHLTSLDDLPRMGDSRPG